MQLSSKETRILGQIELQATQSHSAVAKALGLKNSTVRYQIESMIAKGLILRKRTYVNPYVLGYQNIAIYFSVAPKQASDLAAFGKRLSETPQITWFAEVGGEYQYAISFSLEHVHELAEFQSELLSGFKELVFGKTTSIRLNVYTFPRKYLAGADSPGELFQGGGPAYVVDETDHIVLHALAETEFESFREVAARAQIPSSTFDRRLKLLEEKGVITGHYYVLNVSQMGVQEYRLLIQTRTACKRLSKALLSFARTDKWTRKYIECFGNWEYELEVGVFEAAQLTVVVATLYEQFRTDIQHISVIPLFSEISCPPYSFL